MGGGGATVRSADASNAAVSRRPNVVGPVSAFSKAPASRDFDDGRLEGVSLSYICGDRRDRAETWETRGRSLSFGQHRERISRASVTCRYPNRFVGRRAWANKKRDCQKRH